MDQLSKETVGTYTRAQSHEGESFLAVVKSVLDRESVHGGFRDLVGRGGHKVNMGSNGD